jgi:phenylacetate-CoA ligase
MSFYPFLIQKVIMPTISLFTPLTIWNEYRRMMQAEKLSQEQLREYQFRKIKEILNHANEKVPFYRERFNEIGLKPDDIHDDGNVLPLPPTTKEDIMAHFPEGITAEGMDRSQWKYVASSGTTRQIMGIHDFSKANSNWAAGLRAHKLAGNHDVGKKWMEIPPHMCTTICGIDDSGKKDKIFSKELFSLLVKGKVGDVGQHIYKGLYSKRQDIYKRVTLPSFGAEGTNIPEKNIDAYINTIREYKPYLLEGLPLYIYTFAKYIIDNNLPAPRVGVIKPFGGSMTQHMKETIKEAFKCDVYDTYGCSEMGFIACDCEKHDGLHLFMDLYYVEVCRNGKLTAPGELGRLYITDLENRAMPWIRYDIGDVGRYFVDDHGCGRKSIRLQVEGRVHDTIANTKGDLFTSDQVFDFFHGLKGIDNFQLIEKSPGKFDLLYVTQNGSTLDKEKIGQQFCGFFDQRASLKVYPVKTIKSEDGGKFRFIKSKNTADI